jgi:hypothetical protein
MVSSEGVSLFSNVPIRDTTSPLSRQFEAIPRLFCHVLTAPYFSFAGQFYEQIDGVPMGSPLSPFIANFFMEDFDSDPVQQHCLFSGDYNAKQKMWHSPLKIPGAEYCMIMFSNTTMKSQMRILLLISQ